MLFIEKVTILAKYLDFIDIFSKKLAAKFFKCTNINKLTINLEFGKQLFSEPVYSLELVKLKTLNTYIKTNLANNFTCLF